MTVKLKPMDRFQNMIYQQVAKEINHNMIFFKEKRGNIVAENATCVEPPS